MSSNDLFCTPEQGRRLKELVPELTSVFVWASLQDGSWFIIEQRSITDGAFVEFRPTFTPALTLQELRDVARKITWEYMCEIFASLDDNELNEEYRTVLVCEIEPIPTAPELAAWVIERLEDTV